MGFKPLYGRDHPKTQAALKKNREKNPTVTQKDIERWEQMERERIAREGRRDWGPEQKDKED